MKVPRSLIVVLGLYCGALCLSAIFSREPGRSFERLATECYLLVIPVAAMAIIRTERELRRSVQAWLIATAVVTGVGVATLLTFVAAPSVHLFDFALNPKGTLPPGPYPRFNLTFFNPALLGSYLGVSILLLLASRPTLPPALFWPLLAATALCAFLSLTPGLGGVVLGSCLWLFLEWRFSRPRQARLVLAAGVTGALLFLVAAAVTPFLHPTAPFLIHVPLFGTVAPSARLMFWIASLNTFAAHPLFGNGIGIDPIAVLYQNPSGVRGIWRDAHNAYLSVGAQAGIVGLAAVLALIWRVASDVKPLASRPCQPNLALALGVAWLCGFAWEGLVGSFENTRHLWVCLGLFYAARNVQKQDEPPPPQSSDPRQAPPGVVSANGP